MTMTSENASGALDTLIKGMDKIMEGIKPDLDKVEAELLKNMAFFGASEYDIQQIKSWLRPLMENEMRKQIFLKVTQSLDKSS